MSSQNRSLRYMFVRPRFQMRISLYYIVIGGLILCAVGFLVLNKLDAVQAIMNSGANIDYQTQSQINEMLLESVQMSLIGFGVFILFSFLFALVVSHRIAGPQMAIVAYIEELKKGNYDYKRNLRPHDELSEIMDSLKELAPILKADKAQE